MTQIPESNYSPQWAGDDRPEPLLTADERATLTSALDWQRATFALKCSGVPADRMSDRGIPPSTMSLHGLLRHLTAIERWSFRIQFAGEDVPMLYYTDDDPDQDFESLDGDVGEAMALWRSECDESRRVISQYTLDDAGALRRTGKPISLRAMLVRVIAEYARHNGHADLLRERIDGAIGH